MKFYTYVYFINDIPNYVGKGTGTRLFAHRKDKCDTHFGRRLKKSIIEGHKVEIKLYPAISEQHALDFEVELIAKYGRADLGMGPLLNLTDGDRGTIRVVMSQEARDKISKGNKGKPKSAAHRKAVGDAQRGTKHPNFKPNPNTWLKQRGVPKTEEHKRKLAEGQARRFQKGCVWNKGLAGLTGEAREQKIRENREANQIEFE